MQSINATIKNNATIINTTIKKKCDNKKTQQNKMQSIKHNKTQQNKMQSIKHNNKHATNPNPNHDKHNQTKCNRLNTKIKIQQYTHQ